MSEIRPYRGKTYKGEWVFGNIVQNYIMPVTHHIAKTAIFTGREFVEVIPETVGQFTGRCDEFKEHLYNGDIVEVDNGCESFLCEIVEDKDNCAFVLRELYGDRDRYDFEDFEDVDLKKIGNVFDNPEKIGVRAGVTNG